MRDRRAACALWTLLALVGCGNGGSTPAGTGKAGGGGGGAAGEPAGSGGLGAGGGGGGVGGGKPSGGAGGAGGAAGAAGSPATGGTSGVSGAGGVAGAAGAAGASGAGGGAGMGGAGGSPAIPFENYLVLRLETDAPNGLQPNGAWRDLSASAHTITIASGTPQVVATGTSGAKAMTFDGTGPIFQIADVADLRFGATDDFFIVARVMVEAPPGTSCTNRFLVAKLAADQTGPAVYECGTATRTVLTSSLQIDAIYLSVPAPIAQVTSFGVVSFGRNSSGVHIETVAGTTSLDTTVVSPVDVSATGSAFGIGGLVSQGTPSAAYSGQVNRLYVFHAPGGTFAAADFAAIRAWVANAAPVP